MMDVLFGTTMVQFVGAIIIATALGDVPCSVEKGEAGMVGLRGQAASLMVSMALFAFAFFT